MSLKHSCLNETPVIVSFLSIILHVTIDLLLVLNYVSVNSFSLMFHYFYSVFSCCVFCKTIKWIRNQETQGKFQLFYYSFQLFNFIKLFSIKAFKVVLWLTSASFSSFCTSKVNISFRDIKRHRDIVDVILASS